MTGLVHVGGSAGGGGGGLRSNTSVVTPTPWPIRLRHTYTRATHAHKNETRHVIARVGIVQSSTRPGVYYTTGLASVSQYMLYCDVPCAVGQFDLAG